MKPALTTVEQIRRPLASRAWSRNQVRFGSAVKFSTVCLAASTSICAFSFRDRRPVGVWDAVGVWAVTRAAVKKRAHNASTTRIFMGSLQTSNLSDSFDGLIAIRGHGPARQPRHIERYGGRDQDAGAEDHGNPRSRRHGWTRALGFSGRHTQ